MATTLVRASFDGLSLAVGDAITTANSASPDAFNNVVGSAITYDTAHPGGGVGGAKFVPATSTSTYLEWTGLTNASQACAVEFDLYFTALPATNTQPLLNVRSAGGGTGLWTLQINTAGKLLVTSDANAGATVGTATTSLSVNTLYRVSVQATNATTTTGTMTVTVYTPASSTSAVSGAGLSATGTNIGTSGMGTFRFGRPAVIGSSWTFWMDELAAQTGSSTAIGWLNTPLGRLTDAFATQDTGKWTWGARASLASGRVSLPLNADYGGFIQSKVGYDLTGSSVIVQVPQYPNVGNGTTEAYIQLDILGTSNVNTLQWHSVGSSLIAAYHVSSAVTTVATLALSSTDHKWLRIRHNGTQVVWDTSPDSSTWTQQATWTPTFSLTNLQVTIGSGFTGTEPAPGTAIVDNVNVPSNAPSFTVSASPSGSGTLTATQSVTLTLPATPTGSGTLAATVAPAFATAVSLSGSGSLAASLPIGADFGGDSALTVDVTGMTVTVTAGLFGDSGLTVTSVAVMPEIQFQPPYTQRRVPLDGDSALTALMNFGLAVYRIGGQWFEAEYPPPSAFVEADLFFEGGHVHVVDADTAAILNAAGYETTEVFL